MDSNISKSLLQRPDGIIEVLSGSIDPRQGLQKFLLDKWDAAWYTSMRKLHRIFCLET